MSSFSFSRRNRRGWALAISLVVLLVLTLIGVTLLRIPGLEENLTDNFKQLDQTFEGR